MTRLSRRAIAVKPSATLATAAKVREMKAEGIDVVGFGMGEPDFDTPEHVKEAAVVALREGFTKYPALTGIAPLKDAVVAKFKRDQGLDYELGQIIVSVGAKHTLYNICQALLDTGDEAIIPGPFWVSYPDMVILAGATPVHVPGDPEVDFVPKAADIEAAINENTRLVFLNSPSNPTGTVYPRSALEELGEMLLRHPQVSILTDDIYEKILYDGREFLNILDVTPDLYDRTFVVNGVSKAYAMTGWRIGYCGGPKDAVAAMARIQGQSTSGATGIAQRAAVAALNGDQRVVDVMVAEFARRRERILELLRRIDGIRCFTPGGAFYVFPDVRALFERRHRGERVENSMRLCELLLEHQHVAVVPGAPFGAEGFLRLSFATSMDQIEEGVGRIAAFVDSLT